VTEAPLRVGLAITYELYCCWAIVDWKCWGL